MNSKGRRFCFEFENKDNRPESGLQRQTNQAI
jgi:hypothetical protein